MMEWLVQFSGYIVLIGFFSAFVGVALWAYRPSNKDKLEQHRNIPFKGDE